MLKVMDTEEFLDFYCNEYGYIADNLFPNRHNIAIKSKGVTYKLKDCRTPEELDKLIERITDVEDVDDYCSNLEYRASSFQTPLTSYSDDYSYDSDDNDYIRHTTSLF